MNQTKRIPLCIDKEDSKFMKKWKSEIYSVFREFLIFFYGKVLFTVVFYNIYAYIRILVQNVLHLNTQMYITILRA